MQKNKFAFCLFLILLMGLICNLWAQNKNMFTPQQKLHLQKIARMLPPEARSCLPPEVWTSEKPCESSKSMTGTGAISGTVTKAAGGGGITGVYVRAHLCECPSSSGFALTDASGNYTITGLTAGRYTVWTDNDSIFTDVYYNHKTWQNADTITVGSGTISGINFSLNVGAQITGKLTLTGLTTYGIVFVEAIDTLTNQYYISQASLIGVDTATYVVKRLPTGKFRIKTYSMSGYIDEYYDDKSDAASATVISVTEGSTYSSKNISLDLGGIIKGTITGSGALNHIQVFAYYVPNKFEWLNMTGITNSSGVYRLTGLRSGAWKVFCYADTTYAWEWYNNASSWNSAASVTVTAPDSVTGKNFSLEIGGSISGHVYDAGANPINDCQVIAFDSSFFEIGQGMRGTNTNSSGYYKIGGLRTGSYTVEASTACDNQFYNHKDSIWDADPVGVTMPSNVTGINFNIASAVEEEEDQTGLQPTSFELKQNYPNPFNPGTEIEYTLHKSTQVNLTIYNLLGQKVKTLLSERQPVGSYKITWDGKNEQGKTSSSGIYFYRLEVNGVPQTKRMVLLK